MSTVQSVPKRKMANVINIFERNQNSLEPTPPRRVEVARSSGSLIDGTKVEFKICAIAWGRNSYLLFINLLLSRAKLHFKAVGVDMMYYNLQDFTKKYQDKKVLMCTLSVDMNYSESNIYVVEFHFEGTVPLNMLMIQKEWVSIEKVSLSLDSGEEVDFTIEQANKGLVGNKRKMITGLFFPNSVFDPVVDILATYYDRKCALYDCVKTDDPNVRRQLGVATDGIIKKDNLTGYWNSVSTKTPGFYSACAIAKHDKSASEGVATNKMLSLDMDFDNYFF